MVNSVCVSKTGASHLQTGRPLQDSARVFTGVGYSIFAVADGHGSEPHFRSQIGSQIAVEVAQTEWQRFWASYLQTQNARYGNLNLEETIANIEKNIICSWKHRVRNHIKNNPLSDEEFLLAERLNIPWDILPKPDDSVASITNASANAFNDFPYETFYGTTLLTGICIGKKLFIVLQIGDGEVLLRHSGREEILTPVPVDPEQGFGFTKSLCSATAQEDFRYAYGNEPLDFICACTDGVQDSYAPEDLKQFIKDIFENVRNFGQEATQKELEEVFPIISERGSRDDVSLAALFFL